LESLTAKLALAVLAELPNLETRQTRSALSDIITFKRPVKTAR